jgi:hypothetical protein
VLKKSITAAWIATLFSVCSHARSVEATPSAAASRGADAVIVHRRRVGEKGRRMRLSIGGRLHRMSVRRRRTAKAPSHGNRRSHSVASDCSSIGSATRSTIVASMPSPP